MFLHHRLECTIIEPSNILAKISKLIVPSACVINSTASQFHELIRLNKSSLPPVTTHTQHKIFHDIGISPISASNFPIHGIDFSISIPISLPLPHVLPLPFSYFVSLVNDLANLRTLSCFVLFCNIDNNAKSTKHPDIKTLQNHLPFWELSAQMIYAPYHNDPISAHRLLIVGNLGHSFTGEPNPLPLKHNIAQHNRAFSSCVNTTFDRIEFSTLSVQPSAITPSSINASPDAPCPLDIICNNYPDTTDIVVLHPSHPAIESQYIRSRNVYYIPFRTPASTLTHLRAITPIEQLHLYLAGIEAVTLASFTELVMGNPDHIAVAGHACPWNTAHDIVSTLIDTRLQDLLEFSNTSRNEIVRCHITKALPTNNKWKQAYADDKDENYLI